MKCKCITPLLRTITICLMSVVILAAGCTNVNPVNPPSQYPSTPPTQPSKQATDYIVTYNYGDTDPVQLSANNLVLKVGDKLILQPAPGLSKSTHFSSTGENFFGDVMKQEIDEKETGKVVFTAIAPGKGKLQVIPNSNETSRATDFWVTVQTP